MILLIYVYLMFKFTLFNSEQSEGLKNFRLNQNLYFIDLFLLTFGELELSKSLAFQTVDFFFSNQITKYFNHRKEVA